MRIQRQSRKYPYSQEFRWTLAIEYSGCVCMWAAGVKCVNQAKKWGKCQANSALELLVISHECIHRKLTMSIFNDQAEVSDVRFGNKAGFCFTNSLVVQYKMLDLKIPGLCQFYARLWKFKCIFPVVFKGSINQFGGSCMI